MSNYSNLKPQASSLKPSIALAAGGTGGHVFAAVGMAGALREHGLEPLLVCPDEERSRRFLAAEPEAGKAASELYAWGFGGRVAGMPHTVVKLVRLLKRRRTDVVVSLGGYAGLAGGIAAKLLRIPLIVYEENAVLGRANRLLAPLAALRLATMPVQSRPDFRVVGLPLRRRLVGSPEAGARRPESENLSLQPSAFSLQPPVVLVMGGSQGARALDEAMVNLYGWLAGLDGRPALIHLCGPDLLRQAQAAYQREFAASPEWAGVHDFRSDMEEVYGRASLVVCRAGALTVAELSYFALPAVLVPYPYAGYHQLHNARALAIQQPAITRIVEQGEDFAGRLRQAIGELLAAGARRPGSTAPPSDALAIGNRGDAFIAALRGVLEER